MRYLNNHCTFFFLSPMGEVRDICSDSSTSPAADSPFHSETPAPAIFKYSRKKRRLAEALSLSSAFDCVDLLAYERASFRPSRQPFQGVASLGSDDERYLSLTGVSRAMFRWLDCLLQSHFVGDRPLSGPDQLLLTLMKLRLGLPQVVAGCLFGVSKAYVADTFPKVVALLDQVATSLLRWQRKRTVLRSMPDAFKKQLPSCRLLLDSFEVTIDLPDERKDEARHFRSSRSGSFASKYLLGVAPHGQIVLLCGGWGASVDNYELVKESGLLHLLQEGDVVLTDILPPRHEEGFCPVIDGLKDVVKAFPSRKYLLKEEGGVEDLRAPLEKVRARLRCFRILDHFSLDVLPLSSQIMRVVCGLCNLMDDE